jgi:hypothetical protein
MKWLESNTYFKPLLACGGGRRQAARPTHTRFYPLRKAFLWHGELFANPLHNFAVFIHKLFFFALGINSRCDGLCVFAFIPFAICPNIDFALPVKVKMNLLRKTLTVGLSMFSRTLRRG